jgi:hypothetical protein
MQNKVRTDYEADKSISIIARSEVYIDNLSSASVTELVDEFKIDFPEPVGGEALGGHEGLLEGVLQQQDLG